MFFLLQRFLSLALFLAMLTIPLHSFASPEITDMRATATYWTSRTKSGDAELLDIAGREALNAKIRSRDDTLTVLSALPSTMTSKDILKRIERLERMNDLDANAPALYTPDAPIDQAYYDTIRSKRNLDALAAADTISVCYGITVRRTNLRLLPTSEGFYSGMSELQRHYDALQATAIDPAEPLAILWESSDGTFYFVSSRTYDGWISENDVVEVSREEWQRYESPKDFAVVTKDKLQMTPDGESLLFQMGAKIPIAQTSQGSMLVFPQKEHGILKEVTLPFTEDTSLHHGYLPITKNNFIRQAFCFLGDEYGWGGQDNSVDCSAFTQDIYRSMGIEIPRDADHQAMALPRFISLDALGENTRLSDLSAMPPGTLLANDTHVMMYLGQDDSSTPILIQAMSSYFTFNGGRQKHYNRRVAVTTALFPSYRGTPYIMNVKGLGSIDTFVN